MSPNVHPVLEQLPYALLDAGLPVMAVLPGPNFSVSVLAPNTLLSPTPRGHAAVRIVHHGFAVS